MMAKNFETFRQKHIQIRQISSAERSLILAARKITGKDLPTFYHDAIVEKAHSILAQHVSAPTDS